MELKNKFLFLLTVSCFCLASCEDYTAWNKVGTSNTINYCLLIGQIDHNDSSARTAGIRHVLGTRDLDHMRTNPNTENPIVNNKFYVDSNGVTYKIVEMEHGEQKSISGTTWDQQTANETTTLWINKHYANSWIDLQGKKQRGQSISFFVSNNDGMAMGAIGSVRWPSGMPIFGYDANNDVIEAIHDGKVTGTVDQAATGQAAGIYMTARNLIDHPEYTKEQAVTSGFGEKNANSYGYVKSDFQGFDSKNNAKLSRNIAVTKNNVGKFYRKSISEKLAQNECIKHDETQKNKAKIYQSYYSATDNFLNSSMKPLFAELSEKFNFEVTSTFGNGNDEVLALDNLNTNLAKGKYFNAFIINMVKTTSTLSYLDAIYSTYAENDGKVHVPVIFWNRQPTTSANVVDTAAMNDPRFKFIYYIGFDAVQGGEVQGEMIKEYLINQIEGKEIYE